MFGFRRNKTKGVPVISPVCIGCGICVSRCRRNVLSMSENTTECLIRVTHPEYCSGCGKCMKSCPEDAIRLISLNTVL